MRVFIAVLVLIFSLQSWTKADDISEFEIEGMSVGDSMLDFITKKKIIKMKRTSQNKLIKYARINYRNGLEIYDAVQIFWHIEDKKYIIAALGGIIEYDNDIESCKKKMTLIVSEIKDQINFKSSERTTQKSSYDKNGKVHMITNYLENGDLINIQCYEFSEPYKKKYNYVDALKVMVVPKVFEDHHNEANK